MFIAISALLWFWLIKDLKKYRQQSKAEQKKLRERYARLAVLSFFFFLVPIFALFFPLYVFSSLFSCF